MLSRNPRPTPPSGGRSANASRKKAKSPKNAVNQKLLLPELLISGFRGISELRIGRLGRVTLLAGKNGVGKTTILEAVQLFASRGCDRSVWRKVLDGRDEYLMGGVDVMNGGKTIQMDAEALFHGREQSRSFTISIGSSKKSNQLKIRFRNGKQRRGSNGEKIRRRTIDFPFLARYDSQKYPIPLPFQQEEGMSLFQQRLWQTEFADEEMPAPLPCLSLMPGLLRNEDVANLWDQAAEMGVEGQAVEALRVVFGDDLERINVVGDNRTEWAGSAPTGPRRAIAKLKNRDRAVPLRSLGDGAVRIFGLALALAGSRNGFLVIDEMENGIHYSIQADVWKMLFQEAEKNNVQVIATTHGWDCVKKFAEVALTEEDIEGLLVRLEKKDEHIQSVEYSKEELLFAIQNEFEVR